MRHTISEIKGLDLKEVLSSRALHGENTLVFKKESGWWHALKSLGAEPMILLLLLASVIYFISGEWGDGIFLSVAILLIAAISLYQDRRSRNALEKLKEYTRPRCRVIREGAETDILSFELVVGDYLIIEEGDLIPADGGIVSSNDFSVNESLLTGESMPVFKDATQKDPNVYRGTLVVSGLAIVLVHSVGLQTKLGKIGKSLEEIEEEKTPLEKQIKHFVKKMALLGGVAFCLVWALNFLRGHDAVYSLLKALTLAMSVLPEEIPVAFTTFMAIGAWRLMKMGIVVKQMKTVETLGSATVICADKTGTLTQNKMALACCYVFDTDHISEPMSFKGEKESALIRTAMWASESIPFDTMEMAIHEAYEQNSPKDERPLFKMVHEYPLGGKPPMMTHVFENKLGEKLVAAKGAPEALLDLCLLSEAEKNRINKALVNIANQGYRILGVAEAEFKGDDYPKAQQDFHFHFKGLIAFHDPPKENIPSVLQAFYRAGIKVKIITGDNPTTTRAIARQIGFEGWENNLTGDQLMALSQPALLRAVNQTHVFTRMFPEAKLKIIEALKENGEVVAMTGDGVNDGPALKAAHIGIAMGKKGSEIARQSASLILIEDDLAKMIDAVAMGRKIYSNLKKAIQYIISIHIPIIFSVLLPLALSWKFPNIFSPIHVILLEVIMGITCSIIYENEPMEAGTLAQKPRAFSHSFFDWSELNTSIIQGLAIAGASMLVYAYALYKGGSEANVRSLVFMLLIFANIFLTLVDRSFYHSLLTVMKYENRLIWWVILASLGLSALLLFVPPLTHFFEFEQPTIVDLFIVMGIACASVVWYEGVKLYKRRTHTF